MISYTPKQRQIMDVIRGYVEETGMSPTLEEIGTRMGVHRVTVHQHITALIRKGALKKLPQRSRSLEIMDPDFTVGRVNTLVLEPCLAGFQVVADNGNLKTEGSTRADALGQFLKLHHERLGIVIDERGLE